MEKNQIGIMTNIKAEGFKSIKEMDLELKSLNIIIGQNGAGKSNLISIFKFLYNVARKELQGYAARHGGTDRFLHFGRKKTKQILIDIRFAGGSGYSISIVPDVNDNFVITEESESICEENREYGAVSYARKTIMRESALDESSAANAGLKEIKTYHFHDTGDDSPIKRTNDISNNIFLQVHANNLTAFLYRLKENYKTEYDEIVSAVKMAAPFFQDFILEPSDDGKYISFRWKHSGFADPLNIDYLSDGTLRFIALAVLLLQPDKTMPKIIVIDEPELGLHPYALKILAELMRKAAERGIQIIATSQSVDFVNEFDAQDIIVADREGDASVFRRLDEKKLEQWLEEFGIGDIWSKNIIGGNPNDF